MFKITLMEALLRAGPEAIIFMMAIYIFTKTKFDWPMIGKLCITLVVGIFVIRALPISYGIHTILIVILAIFLTTTLGKIDVTRAIRAAIITTLIQVICEGINITWIQYCLKQDLEIVFADRMMKLIYGMPSLALTALMIGIYYFSRYKLTKVNE
ncbi:MAG: hypothetical protein ACRDDX_13715 [Cellulosilyticaceae bacterium]